MPGFSCGSPCGFGRPVGVVGPQVCVPVGASDADAALAEKLEFTLGEGPCSDCYASQRTVLVADIDQPSSPAWARWPTYTAELINRTSYRGVFGFPLLAEGSAMGSLHLYQRSPDRIDDIAGTVAVVRLITSHRLGGSPATTPIDDHDLRWLEGPLARCRFQVWRAQGLIMQVNGLDAQQALDLVRAYAYTVGRLLEDIAADILAERLPVPDLRAPHRDQDETCWFVIRHRDQRCRP